MKKVLFITLCLVLCSTLFALVGCNKNNSLPEEKSNVSYIQTTFYYGQNANFDVKICGGLSEVLFVADGKTNEVQPFMQITVIPQSVDLYNNDYSFTIFGSDGEVQGSLTKDAFGSYFSQDVDLSKIGEVLKVELTYSKFKQEIPLTNMLADKISAKQALESAQNALKEKLDCDNKEREIYIRMINNTNKPESEYFWYVAFISTPTDYYSCLVNPNDGVVVSSN